VPAPTLAQLRKLAHPATVENDREAGCYRATAPAGYRWEKGLHEFVAWYEGEPCWMVLARADLAARLQGRSPERCNDPACDWCADA
jgi:hypothetical protein